MIAEIFGPDILIILAVVAVLFGGAKLPKLARSLGSAKSQFEAGLRDGADAPAAEKPAPAPETVTMTKAELEAMISEREARARDEVQPPG